MKKMMLCSALFTLLSSQVYSETTVQAEKTHNQNSNETTLSHKKLTVNEEKPVSAPANAPTPATAPIPVAPTTQTLPVTTPTAPVSCNFKIPADTKKVEDSLLITWAEKAAVQSFEFAPDKVDSQVAQLQGCFTDQGWNGFNAALKKSGNVEAIKAQILSVSSQVMGKSQITFSKDNQWKVTVPLQVVYQNEKDKATQLLNIELAIARKPSGDLGITQMVAIPKTNEPVTPVVTNGSTPPSSGTPSTAVTPSTAK